jgi:CDP-diacylglycerol---glycerol-3-phosphate 3-phosphatidyltransferase
MRHRIWNIPNALSISRLPLGAGLFCAISYKEWWLGVLLMTIAALTDWADGWWARKFGPLSPIGRSLDPLTDKVLVCGAFIFLLPVPDAGLHAWMVTVIIARELIVTGLRGIVESAGHVFPADWFGKVKMVLQCVSLIGILLLQAFRVQQLSFFTVDIVAFEKIVLMTLWLTVLVTIVSMLQYLWRAIRLMA